MATVKQIQTGAARFIDTHLAQSFQGWQKALVVGGSTLIVANLPKLVAAYSMSPAVAALGVYNPEAGTIDLDALYQAFMPHLGGDKIPVNVPGVGAIKIGREEIDALMRYIKEA